MRKGFSDGIGLGLKSGGLHASNQTACGLFLAAVNQIREDGFPAWEKLSVIPDTIRISNLLPRVQGLHTLRVLRFQTAFSVFLYTQRPSENRTAD